MYKRGDYVSNNELITQGSVHTKDASAITKDIPINTTGFIVRDQKNKDDGVLVVFMTKPNPTFASLKSEEIKSVIK